DESVARDREGIEQVDLLLREEGISHRGRFHTIENTTSLPRPTQRPRPKFYVAALNTPESFEYAGRMGYSVMAIAFVAAKMRPLLAAYRQAWKGAGHPGEGEVMIAFHMFCDPDGERARRVAAPLIDNYLHSLVDAASDWLDGRISQDYPGYDKIIAGLRASNAADQMTTGAAWIGTPDEIARTVATMQEDFGGFEHASLQVNFNLMHFEDAMASLRLFAREVMPRFV
ncbi:MAG: LLM class flavin-dependent oxidoreductase, partial [Stellaceae bacterium]